MSLFEIAPVTKLVLSEAMKLNFSDFEDAVLHESAKQVGAQGIVTRNLKGFQKATLSVFSPNELDNMVQSLIH